MATWVRIPREHWPKEWEGMKDPLIRLVKSLYGHPDAGGYWERHCTTRLKECGFEAMEDWRSVYWDAKRELLLMVYVGDFNMSGPSKNLAGAWKQLKARIKMDDPGPVHRCLGCTHLSYDGVVDGNAVRFMDDDMTQFMGACVDSYLKLAPNAKITKAPTPYVDPHVIPNGYAGSSDVENELDIGGRGELAPHAASVLMKVLDGARKVRWVP